MVVGNVLCRDTDAGQVGDGYQRVAELVTAAPADDAEVLAYELFENAHNE